MTLRWLMSAFLSLILFAGPALEAHAQPVATPVIETPEPSPKPIETPAIPGTPEPEIDGAIATPGPSIMRTSVQPLAAPVQGSTGSLSGCTQSSATINPGGTIAIHCSLTITVNVVDNATGRVMRPAMTGGYQASIDIAHQGFSSSLAMGSTAGRAQLAMGTSGLGGGRVAAVTIIVRAPATAMAGSTYTQTFTSCRVGNVTNTCYILDPQNGSVTARFTVASLDLVDGIHYQASCDPPSPATVGFGQNAISNCRVTALDSIGNRKLRLEDLVTSLGGSSGWTGRLINASGTPTGYIPSLYNLDPPPELAAGQTFNWKISLTPTGCSAGNAPLTLSVRGNITPVLNGVAGNTITTSPRQITVGFVPPASSVSSASVVSAPEPVEVPYSMTEEQNKSANFTMRYTVSGCQHWDGYAQMSPFVDESGDGSGIVPQVSSVQHISTRHTGSGFTVVEQEPVDTIGAITPTHLLSGTRPGMEVQVEHTVEIHYTIPPNTPAGTYESTITVSITRDAP